MWRRGLRSPRRLAAGAWLIGAAGLAHAAAPAPVHIELRPQVTPAGASVNLGDVAYLRSRDLPLLRALLGLRLGVAPRLGRSDYLERDTLARWVDAAGFGGRVEWSGARAVRIESAVRELPAETVVSAAREALSRWLAQRAPGADVHALTAGHDLRLPPGPVELRVRPLPDAWVPGRRVLVWVDAWVNGRFARSAAVPFEVEGPRGLPTAQVHLDRGVVLDPVVRHGAFEPGADAAWLASAADAAPKQLSRGLRPGEPLVPQGLENAPAVRRGAFAAFQSRTGAVRIEGRVEVLQDGQPGDRVRVRIPGAREEALARVLGADRVELQP